MSSAVAFTLPQYGTDLDIHTASSSHSFMVRACASINISLYPNSDTSSPVNAQYVFHLGANQNTQVTLLNGQGAVLSSAPYVNHLSCDQSERFWTSWGDGVVRLGEGAYPHHVIIEYSDPGAPLINTLSLGTVDLGVKAEWQLERKSGISEISFTSQILMFAITRTIVRAIN